MEKVRTQSTTDVIDMIRHIDIDHAHNKGFINRLSQPPRLFHLTTLLVMIWGIVLIAGSTFFAVQLPDPITWFMAHQLHMVPYSFQVATVILVCGVLGRRFGLITLLLFMLAGLAGLPVFAGGGGIHYLGQIGMGYLVGFLLVPSVMQPYLIRAYHNTGWLKGRSVWLAIAAITAVLAIHLCGAVGITIHLLIQHQRLAEIMPWIAQLSWPAILYDVAFGLVAVSLARLLRIALWFCLY